MVWGGATLDVLARMKREQKHMGGARLDYRKHLRGERGLGAAGKESFDCFFVCEACGYLCETTPPCPSCGASTWIDLDYWANAEALRALEEDQRRSPPTWVRRRVGLASLAAGTALGTATTAALTALGVVSLGPLGLLALGAGSSGVAAALTHGLGQRRLSWALMTRRVRHPTRWRVPLPFVEPGADVRERFVGVAQARGGLLQAPFSGRACIGYEIAVLFDNLHDAWPPTWALREVRSCAFEVQGQEVAADTASLAIPIAPVAVPAMDDLARHRFMRQRGLFLADGQFDFFEAVLEPGATVEVVRPSAPAGAPVIVRTVRGAPKQSPYR